MRKKSRVLVIGAGLAGSEAAWFLANRGVNVILAESKRVVPNPAQKIPYFAELVCTNSLKSKEPASGHGILKVEMQALGSLVLEAGNATAVPAGGALAVDREKFSLHITQKLEQHPNVEIVDELVSDPIAFAQKVEADRTIVATGPLTAAPLENWLKGNLGPEDLYFYDAIAPVVDADSLNLSGMYLKDRHADIEDGTVGDYLNVPLNKEQYELFVNELVAAEKVQPKDFEEAKFFESCLPIDLMAERGVDTARFSCMKPIGLKLDGQRLPHAVIQLRKENLLGSAFNLVGFQTRLTYKEQIRVFRLIPGFEEATFVHLGSVHRNTFLNSKKVLKFDLSSREFPRMSFAGQMTGVEGYTESASMGLYVAWQIWRELRDMEPAPWPVETAIGALINYVMTSPKPAPSNINFGLLPTVALTSEERKNRKNRKRLKKEKVAARAVKVLSTFLEENPL